MNAGDSQDEVAGRELSQAQRIDSEAGEWLARHQHESWDAAAHGAFERWLESSPRHRVAWLRLEHGWERAGRLKALKSATQRGVPAPGEWSFSPFIEPRGASRAGSARERVVKVLHRRAIAIGLAASLLVAVVAVMAVYLVPQASTHRTLVGRIETVAARDGSRITLNTATEIRVAFTRDRRNVELSQGEALFEVAKDPKRPFVVQAGNKRVIAVGTRFSVRRERDDNVSVAVTEGQVRIETDEGTAAPLSQILAAGKVAHTSATGVLVQSRSLPELEETLSWRTGVLVFHGATLAQAVAEFNRYNTRQIVIEDAALGALPIAGAFRATNASAFVRLLQQGFGVQVTERGEVTVLTASR